MGDGRPTRPLKLTGPCLIYERRGGFVTRVHGGRDDQARVEEVSCCAARPSAAIAAIQRLSAQVAADPLASALQRRQRKFACALGYPSKACRAGDNSCLLNRIELCQLSNETLQFFAVLSHAPKPTMLAALCQVHPRARSPSPPADASGGVLATSLALPFPSQTPVAPVVFSYSAFSFRPP